MTTSSAFDPRVADISQSERRNLLDVARRMLADVGLAGHVVQEAFLRLTRADLDPIGEIRGWLVVVVGRPCLDHIRDAAGLAPLLRRAATDVSTWLCNIVQLSERRDPRT
jgi:RNA polymerase sigma-70 factor (ECF subfamily)